MREVMEGLKNMVANAMGDDRPNCVQCGKWIEEGNTGTVCGACTQSMLGMGNPFQPLSSHATSNPEAVVMLTLHGIGVTVAASLSLANLANSIQNSMTPEEVAMLVRLLTPVSAYGKSSNDLPDDFWQAIKDERKIIAIKELRAASALSLKSSKNIVDAILDKPKDEDESKDKDDSDESDKDKDESEDQDESNDDESSDKPEDADQDQDDSDDSESDDSGEPEPDPDGGQEGDQDGDEFPDLEDIDIYDEDDYGDPEEGDGDAAGELGGDQEVSEAEAEVTDEAPEGADTATAEALAALAAKAHDNGKNYSEDEIKDALKTLGIQF